MTVHGALGTVFTDFSDSFSSTPSGSSLHCLQYLTMVRPTREQLPTLASDVHMYKSTVWGTHSWHSRQIKLGRFPLTLKEVLASCVWTSVKSVNKPACPIDKSKYCLQHHPQPSSPNSKRVEIPIWEDMSPKCNIMWAWRGAHFLFAANLIQFII